MGRALMMLKAHEMRNKSDGSHPRGRMDCGAGMLTRFMMLKQRS